MTAKQALIQLADKLPDERLRELVNFAQFLASQPAAADHRSVGDKHAHRSLLGIWKDCSISDEEISEVRRKMWETFPREVG